MRVNENGDNVPETKFREEVRTRTLAGKRGPKVYKLAEVTISTAAGGEPSEGDLKSQLDGKTPIVLLREGQSLSAAYRKVLKPKAILISVPKSPEQPLPAGNRVLPRGNNFRRDPFGR